MEQVLICLEKREELKLDMLNVKQKALFDLGQAIIFGNKDSIRLRVKDVIDVGSSREEIMALLSWMIKNEPSLKSICYLIKALDFEESERQGYIDVINDCKET